jgi:hypothetical protein
MDPARAIWVCRRGLEVATRIGDLGFRARLYTNLAVACCTFTDHCGEEGVPAAEKCPRGHTRAQSMTSRFPGCDAFPRCLPRQGGKKCGSIGNLFGIALDQSWLRCAAAEGVTETVIAAVSLLHQLSVEEIAGKLTPAELADVTRLVNRCPSCYPPGAYDALKALRNGKVLGKPIDIVVGDHQGKADIGAAITPSMVRR